MTSATPAPAAPAQGPATFDARALLEPVDPAAAAAYAKANLTPEKSASTAAQIIAWVIVGVSFLLVVPALLFMVLGIGYTLGRGPGVAVAAAISLFAVAGLVVGGILLSRRAKRLRDITRFRLSRFAAANALSYIERIENPPLPGMIFHTGSGRKATDVLRGLHPRFVEFGNYEYTTSNGKQTQTHNWGYVAVKLDVPLPNIVLDALGNNTLGNTLAAGFSRDQRLSLEGDFDRYFSLFCPAGYEADALYLFTPDVMARFIHHAAELDVEIVDDWLFLYTRRSVSTLDPATWAWLFGAVGAVLVKLDQWARWRDDRLRALPQQAPQQAWMAQPATTPGTPPALPFAVPAQLLPPPPGVAPPGRRLRRRSPWVIIAIVFGVILASAVLPFAVALFAIVAPR